VTAVEIRSIYGLALTMIATASSCSAGACPGVIFVYKGEWIWPPP